MFKIGFLIFVVASLSGCNVFSPVDHPSGDAQILAAARAAFDNGDLDQARQYYAQLSSAYADTTASETGFANLSEYGHAPMSLFMAFVGDMSDSNGGIGLALTNFANALSTNGYSGESTRVADWNVSQTSISDPDTLAFVQFLSYTALAVEILSEAASTNGSLLQSNLVSSVSGCAPPASCVANASCNAPGGATLTTGSACIPTLPSSGSTCGTTSPTNSQPTTRQLYDAINNSLVALQTLKASGKFSNATSGFTAIQTAVTTYGSESSLAAAGTVDECFRQSLLTLSIGGT